MPFALMSVTHVLFPPFYNSVMLGKGGVASAKFFDFGLAVERSTGTLRTGTFCGTARYISPELERGEEEDLWYLPHTADVHSTAMTVIEFIIGNENFDELVSQTPVDASTGEKFQKSELVTILKTHKVSASGIDLLCRMTDPDPHTRISAVAAMGHCWLKEAKCLNPYLQKGAEEHSWVFHQAERLENLRTKNAKLQEKVTVLETQVSESASADQKLDSANEQVSEAAKNVAELQAKNANLEKTISALKQALSTAAAKKTELEGAAHLPGANVDSEAATISMFGGSEDVLTLVKMILKGPTPLDWSTFLEYDTFHGDVERHGSLLVFACLFESRWEQQRSEPVHCTLEAFLVMYGNSLDNVLQLLKDKAKHGKKYYGRGGYTKRTLDDNTVEGKAREGARKQVWKRNAQNVAKAIHSKCVEGGIDSANTFHGAVEIIGPVINAVFNETAGFEVVTESCRQYFAEVLAAIHVGATSADSEA